MHPDDLKSRGVGVLCAVAGTVLTWLSWSSALADGHYSLKAAMIGPTFLVLRLAVGLERSSTGLALNPQV